MSTTPVDDLATALDAVGQVVERVRPEQWNNPTPCSEWSVRDVLNHLTMGDRMVSEVLRGAPGLAPGAFDPAGRDVLGDDPASRQREAADALLGALRQPGAVDGMYELPVGTVPGIVVVHVRAVEALAHGWDVARATGRRLRVPDEVVERELEFSEGAMVELPRENAPFDPAQPVAADAPPLDRLIGLLGRPVTSPR